MSDDLIPSLGSDFIDRTFGEKRFLVCANELCKNCNDWGATRITFDTTQKDRLVICDNGVGMNAANRKAFLSLGDESTAGETQSGKFDTGAKMMIFCHSKWFEVLTAPKDDPDFVYRFASSVADYKKALVNKKAVPVEKVRKTSKTWPHEETLGRFGTQITFVFREPKSKALRRGDVLATELSARLPMRFQDMVTVDGKELPPKEIIGRVFNYTDSSSPSAGDITFEIYRLKKPLDGEGLFLTSSEVGEVPLRTFAELMGAHAGRIPEIFFSKEVRGVIQARCLRKHDQERRDTFAASIIDDPNALLIVNILYALAPRVQQVLQIKHKNVQIGEEADLGKAVLDVAKDFNEAFSDKKPPESERIHIDDFDDMDDSDTEEEPDEEQAKKRERQPMWLIGKKEIEVGETMTLSARLRSDVGKKYGSDDVRWSYRGVNANVVRNADGDLSVTGTTPGKFRVRAHIPNSAYRASYQFAVVEKRKFRLSTPPLCEVTSGASLLILPKNTDKVKGEIKWRLHGNVGELCWQEFGGSKAVFKATQEGKVRVEAYDSSNPALRAESHITVNPPVTEQQKICVCGTWFILDVRESSLEDFRKPVSMKRGAGSNASTLHLMMINTVAPGFQQAMQQGSLPLFMTYAIASEYARFARFELTSLEDQDLPTDPAGIQALFSQVSQQMFGIIDTMLTSKAKKKS